MIVSGNYNPAQMKPKQASQGTNQANLCLQGQREGGGKLGVTPLSSTGGKTGRDSKWEVA